MFLLTTGQHVVFSKNFSLKNLFISYLMKNLFGFTAHINHIMQFEFAFCLHEVPRPASITICAYGNRM